MKNINSFFLVVLFLFVLPFSGKSQTYNANFAAVVNQTSQTNITDNLTAFENLGVKRRGTAALQNTLDWLKNQYTSFGYAPSQLQEFSYTYSGSTSVVKNLVVTTIGTLYPNTYVIVCGHYDSIVGTGTNDNGSGIVSILEIARLLQNIPTEYSIKFINFSGEEDGLRGSQNYVSTVVNSTTPKMDIKVVFNLDEVGGVAGANNSTITCEKDTASPTSNNAASAVVTNQLIQCVQLYTPLQTLLASAYASDYIPFQSNGEIITGLFETNETTHRHTATDLLVNMDVVYNYNVAKAAVAATLFYSGANASTLGLQTTTFENEFKVFQTATKDSLYFTIGSIKAETIKISLIDLNGKIVLSKALINDFPIHALSIDTLSKGMYLVKLEAEGKSITKKIVLK
ncbi:MAG: aminopeptidase YwaD [Flavobacterium sp.]|jgi:aminopeptidase YwaD